jgi:hypothetical protein
VILCDGNVLVLSGHKKRNQARRLQTGRRNAGCEGRVLYRDCS